MGIKEWFKREKKKVVDFREIGIFSRERNDDLKGYVQIQKKYTGSHPYSLVEVIENRNSQGVNIFGVIASGKSKVADELAYVYGTEEIERLGYDKKTLIIFSPTTHSNNGIMDFRLGIPVIDISTHLPDVFSNVEAFVGAWKLALTKEITNVGIMTAQLTILARKIVNRKPRSWEDYFKIIQQLKRERNDDFDTRLLGIVEDMSQVLVGVANPIEFDFSKSVVLDFSKLESEEAVKFYMELYARIIHKREHDIQKDNNNVVLIVDEAKMLMQHGMASILSQVVLQARTFLRPILLFQNYGDCPNDLHQVATEICFKQTDSESLDQIKARSPFLWECVTKLDSENREFVDLGDNWHLPDGDFLPIYTLDITRLEEYKQRVSQDEKENVYVPDEPREDKQTTERPEQEVSGSESFDREQVKKDIIRVVSKSLTGLWRSEILEALKIVKGNKRYSYTYDIIERMGKDTVRIVDYVTAKLKKGQKARRLVIDGVNEDRAETQLHHRLLEDTEKVLKDLNIKYEVGKINQGFDFTLENYIECETGFKHSLVEFGAKCDNADKKVVVVVPNNEVKERYSHMVSVNSGKVIVCLLNELAEILRSLQK